MDYLRSVYDQNDPWLTSNVKDTADVDNWTDENLCTEFYIRISKTNHSFWTCFSYYTEANDALVDFETFHVAKYAPP